MVVVVVVVVVIAVVAVAVVAVVVVVVVVVVTDRGGRRKAGHAVHGVRSTRIRPRTREGFVLNQEEQIANINRGRTNSRNDRSRACGSGE